MNRRNFLHVSGAGLTGFLVCPAFAGRAAKDTAQLNIVLIVTDDLGYADLGCYGAPKIRTPNLDKLAAEGVMFTDFHMAASVCSPARAAMLTGCYPLRLGIDHALYSRDRIGLHPDEQTLAEILKGVGYHTACIGKWHLGHHPEFMPWAQGFDEFYGVPYSNDMTPFWHKSSYTHPMYTLYEGEEPAMYNPPQEQLTKLFTERACATIKRHVKKNQNRPKWGEEPRPLFLYVPYTAPHEPLHPNPGYAGKGTGGAYGDVIEEVDWGVGEILRSLEENGIADNTLVLFTSDNGPAMHVEGTEHSPGPLRGGKGNSYEGGYRVPLIVRWPGHAPEGATCDAVCSAMDLVPTLAALTGGTVPADRVIDGRDVRPLLTGGHASDIAQKDFFYIQGKTVEAVRRGKWKYRNGKARVVNPETGERETENPGPQLFDLESDRGESRNLVDDHPELADELKAAIEAFAGDLKASARPAGEHPKEG